MPDGLTAEQQERYDAMRDRLAGMGFPEPLIDAQARWAANEIEAPKMRMVPRVQANEDAPNVARSVEESARAEIEWFMPAPISEDEWKRACLAPEIIVELMLYCDVAALIAPGGTGKTTLILWMAAHIVLGLPLFGRPVHRNGPVLIVTAEDTREMLVARLRKIAEALALNEDEIQRVMKDIRISDVSGEGLKLTVVAGDCVIRSPSVDTIIAEAAETAPILVVIDPAISFGIGESRVNDAEQGLIEAARRIRSVLKCCVLYVHHTGKANARDRAVDQYAGRGGSAMADGARMVFVLQPMSADDWAGAAGIPLSVGETGMVLAIPKLSYAPPQPDILICRRGYQFAHARRVERDAGADLNANAEQILNALLHETAKGRQHTKNSFEALRLMPRTDCRDAMNTLLARGQIVLVKSTRKGGPQHFLQVQASPDGLGEPSAK